MNKSREHGMLFSPAMARAIHDGRKAQTRRVITERNSECNIAFTQSDLRFIGGPPSIFCAESRDKVTVWPVESIYKPGDLIWVREAWRTRADWNEWPPREIPNHMPILYSDGTVFQDDDRRPYRPIDFGRKRQSLFMPRHFARSVRRIMSVRPERLQDITEADAIAEGIDGRCPVGYVPAHAASPCVYQYAALWDSLNTERGYSWASNPWVWGIEFEPQNVEAHQ